MSGQPGSHTADADIPNKAQQEAPQGKKENMANARAPGHLASLEGKSASTDIAYFTTTTDWQIQTDNTAADRDPEVARSHAKGGGQASIVPQRIQEELPESVECAVPNALHDTGSK